MRQPDWDDLRIFLEIGRMQSLSLASKRLCLDHSTVSRRLSKLESMLGHRLLERKHDGVVLTSAGRDLLLYSEAMETQWIAAQEALFGKIGNSREMVRLSTYEGVSSFFIAQRLHQFSGRNPQIDVEIMTNLQPVRVERRDADVFLSFYEPEGRSLHAEEVGTLRLYLFATQTYLDANGVPESDEQLRAHRFATYINEHITVDSVRWLDDLICEPFSPFRSTSMITQMNVAAEGTCLVLLPAFCPIERVGLKPVSPHRFNVERKIWISAHRDLTFLPKVKKFVRFLKEIVQQEADMLFGARFLT